MLKSRQIIGLTLSLTILPLAAQGQGIGGLIKRKVGEVAKPKEEPVAKKPTPSSEGSSPFAFELTPETMAALKRGLEVEIKMREGYRARVAKLKTAAQYEQCTNDAAMSPDAQKVMEEYASRSEKVKTQEDMTKVTEWFNLELQKVVERRCGEDPKPLIALQQKEFTKAQYDGAMEFSKAWSKPPRNDQPSSREQDDAFTECVESGAALEDGASIPLHLGVSCVAEFTPGTRESPNATTDARVLEYLKAIELVTKYCSLSKEMRAEAVKDGIRVPGTGRDIYWVFSKDFAAWVGDSCDDVMKLIRLINQ
jgi:hypothetical protein